MNVIECSRAGCRSVAMHHVVWRNPRIHSDDRRKIWPACNEHVQFLHDYLRARDFPVAIERITEPAADDRDVG